MVAKIAPVLDPPIQHCTIRIAVKIIHQEGGHGYKVDYMGTCFLVSGPEVIATVDKTTALAELECTIIRSTGVASYLVKYANHELRVHAQQIRFRRLTAGETVYRRGSDRTATVLANTPYHEPVRLRWSTGQEGRMLPECVESVAERKRRLDLAEAKKKQKKAAKVSAMEERMEMWRR